MPLKPGHMLDQYQVIFLIGEGGMGEVYKAKGTKIGRELYDVSPDGKLMAAGLKLGAGTLLQPYALIPNGKRFLVLMPVGGSQPLEVVANWPALLKQTTCGE